MIYNDWENNKPAFFTFIAVQIKISHEIACSQLVKMK